MTQPYWSQEHLQALAWLQDQVRKGNRPAVPFPHLAAYDPERLRDAARAAGIPPDDLANRRYPDPETAGGSFTCPRCGFLLAGAGSSCPCCGWCGPLITATVITPGMITAATVITPGMITAAPAWPAGDRGAVARWLSRPAGHDRSCDCDDCAVAGIREVTGEPLGLEEDRLPPYGTAGPGCCTGCLTGPLYTSTLCVYCARLLPLKQAASRSRRSLIPVLISLTALAAVFLVAAGDVTPAGILICILAVIAVTRR